MNDYIIHLSILVLILIPTFFLPLQNSMDLITYDEQPKMIIDDRSQWEHSQEFMQIPGNRLLLLLMFRVLR